MPEVNFGKILKHSPKILYRIPDKSAGIGLNVVYKTFGKQYWNAWQKYPEMGVQIAYMNLGNEKILGEAYSLLPNISLILFGKEKTQFRFIVGTGIAYLTKKFDYIDNPTQNTIGSNFNNISVFKFNFHHKLNENLKAFAGFGLTHYSNGAESLPNLGINIITGQLGIQWTPMPAKKDEYLLSIEDPKPDKKFGLSAHTDIAFVEQALPGGPKYPVYIASLGGIYKISKVQQFIVGAEFEYHTSDYYFLLRSTQAKTEKEAKQAASRHLIFVADEFFFWPFSLVLQAGTYLDTDYDYRFGRLFTKLSYRYYLPKFGLNNTRFYIGVQLKAHKFTAEYISLGLGAML
jgi:hypothetical protein